jgi:hypothetical protein
LEIWNRTLTATAFCPEIVICQFIKNNPNLSPESVSPDFKVRLEKAKAGLYLGAERLAATYAGGGNSNTKTIGQGPQPWSMRRGID